jgi:hypothetical protein
MTDTQLPNSNDPNAPPSYTGGVTDGNLAKPITLREFLLGVGTVLRLEKRDPKPKLKAEEKTASGFQLPRLVIPRQVLIGLGGVSGVLLLAAGFVKQDAGTNKLPPTVFGEWVTSNPRYANRSFWLSEQEVRFHLGADGGAVDAYKIKTVTQRLVNDTTYFTINYLQGDKTVTFGIGYVSRPSPAIRFVNQHELVWTLKPNRPARKT